MTSFKANQQRGSWIAQLENGFDELGVDRSDPYIAVVIKDDNLKKASNNTYIHYPPPKMGRWWSLESSTRWRSLMLSGKPILLRNGMDFKTKTAGPKIAFYQIGNVVFDQESFQFEILTRMGECT